MDLGYSLKFKNYLQKLELFKVLCDVNNEYWFINRKLGFFEDTTKTELENKEIQEKQKKLMYSIFLRYNFSFEVLEWMFSLVVDKDGINLDAKEMVSISPKEVLKMYFTIAEWLLDVDIDTDLISPEELTLIDKQALNEVSSKIAELSLFYKNQDNKELENGLLLGIKKSLNGENFG